MRWCPRAGPGLEGSRIATWELRQAGVPHEVITDAAAPGQHRRRRASTSSSSAADRIAANGDVIASAGAYPLALAAHAAGVPFVVCATTTAIDPALADGGSATLEEGRPDARRSRRARRASSPTARRSGTGSRTWCRPTLVTAIVTEDGVLRAPFADALEAAAPPRRRGGATPARTPQGMPPRRRSHDHGGG